MSIMDERLYGPSDEQVADEQILDAFEVDQRLRALSSIYQLTDSIIAGERLKISVVQNPSPIPAWTTGTEIFFNALNVDTRDFYDVVKLHGLNFHELAHVLYSPRAGTSLLQWVIENSMFMSFNILEDQRIESLLTTRYPSTAPWLTAAVMRWVLQEPEALDRGYLFLRGRRFLPGEMRGMLRARFARQDLLPELDRIIDTYRRLVFPTDYDQAQALVRAFDELLREVMPDQSTPDPNGHHHHPENVPNSGRPAPVKQQRELRDRMSQERQDEGNEQGDGDEEGDQQPSPSDAQDSKQDQPSPDSDSDNGHDAGLGSSDRDPFEDIERLEEMLEEILDRDDVRNDVTRHLRQISVATGGENLATAQWFPEAPLPGYPAMANRLARTLERLREESDPGWIREQDFGRLNVVRWATERDVETAFDRWDEGVSDAVDIEAVIMLDISGSMSGVVQQAYNAMWVLKRAFDSVDMSTTVLLYSDDSSTLYRSDERADGDVRVAWGGGGTDALPALQEATRILAASERRHKMLIALTDGQWYPGVDMYGLTADEYITKLNDAGVHTALGYITETEDRRGNPHPVEQQKEWFDKYGHHGCRYEAQARGEALVPFIGDIVTGLIRSQILARR